MLKPEHVGKTTGVSVTLYPRNKARATQLRQELGFESFSALIRYLTHEHPTKAEKYGLVGEVPKQDR